MTVERLVQEHGVDRAVTAVLAAGVENTAGSQRSGSDDPGGDSSEGGRNDAQLAGAVRVQIVLADAGVAGDVRRAFAAFAAMLTGHR